MPVFYERNNDGQIMKIKLCIYESISNEKRMTRNKKKIHGRKSEREDNYDLVKFLITHFLCLRILTVPVNTEYRLE
jgi:hypothetical protein